MARVVTDIFHEVATPKPRAEKGELQAAGAISPNRSLAP
jgi:hypothetical protein